MKNILGIHSVCTTKGICTMCFQCVYVHSENMDISDRFCQLCTKTHTDTVIHKHTRREAEHRYSTHINIITSSSSFVQRMILNLTNLDIPFVFDYCMVGSQEKTVCGIHGTLHIIDCNEQFVVYYDLIRNKKLRRGIPSLTGISNKHIQKYITVNNSCWGCNRISIRKIYKQFDISTSTWY